MTDMQPPHTAGTGSLDLPASGGRSLTTDQRREIDLSARIRGWGSDLDPAMRPGVPRDKEPGIGSETLYPPIEQQVPTVPVHRSNEHARLTPVFGTTCPPSGLSGRVRDFAYRFSEGRVSRWMLLMLADRIDVAQALRGDLARGYVPDLVRETGLATEWRYNRAELARKALIAGLVVAVYTAASRSRHARDDRRDTRRRRRVNRDA